MPKPKSNKLIRLLFILSLFIFVSASILSAYSYHGYRESIAMILHLDDCKDRLELIHSDLKDVETGVRGFVITENEEFLDRYYAKFDMVAPAFNELEKLETDKHLLNAEYLSLENLIKKKLIFMDSLIIIRKQGFEQAEHKVGAVTGKQLMDTISVRINALIKHYEAQKLKVKEIEQTNARISNTLIPLSTGIGIFLFLSVFYLLSIETKKRLESLEKFSVAFSTSPYAIIITRPEDGKFIEVNDTFTSITGFTREEALNNSSIGLSLWGDEKERNHVVNELQSGRSIQGMEFKFKSKEGKTIIGLYSAGLIRINKTNYILSSINDISQLKQADEALRESELKYRTIIETSPDGIAITALDGTIQFVTAKIASMWGFDSADELLGRNTMEFVHPSYHEKAIFFITEMFNGNLTGAAEYLMVHKDGSTFYCEANANILRGADNNPTGILYIERDVTERKQAEKILKETNAYLESATIKANEMAAQANAANKAKSTFLANMGHEIRTPLNAIIGFTQLMNRDKGLSDIQKDYNVSINRAGEHLLMLINDILELSKIEAGQAKLNPVNVDLSVLFKDLQFLFNEKVQSKHLKFAFETIGNLPRFVQVDEGKLRQVFINLIGNAVKFTDVGGITVLIRFDKITEGKNYLFVEIEDTGIGIAEGELNKIFKHFTQAGAGIKKGSGTGLGLALSRELVTLMGGNITVASEVGKGSVFTFYVEITEASIEAIDQNVAKRVICLDKDQKTYRILVVDDRNENLQVLTTLLKMVGFETNKAITGEDAVELFEKWGPDLILMDLRMPVMDGYEATRRIKATDKGSRTPIVALTASTFEHDRKRIEQMGMQGYICKPLRESELFGTIGKVLGITYIYEDETPSSQEIYLNDNELIAGDIDKLQDSLRLQMLDALAVADMKHLKKLIGSIEQEYPEVANHLMALAKKYDDDQLQKILTKKV